MKRCEPIQDQILTDYVDGQLDQMAVARLEGHLLQCAECRAFLREVEATLLPFEQTKPQPVPVELWDSIKRGLQGEYQLTSGELWMDKLKGIFVFPRVVPVFATLMLMLLVGSVTMNNIQVGRAKAQDQGEYLVSLLGSTEQQDNNDSGTPIEHYFL